MGGADDGTQVVRIFHPVQYDEHLASRNRLEVGILARGAQRHHALVGCGTGQAVEGGPLFEPHGHAGTPREIDDLLQARPAGALRDHDTFDGVSGAQGFRHRMDAAEDHRATPRAEFRARY